MYDALILVNGEIPKKVFWQRLSYHLLLCTDGAANTLKRLSLTPDVIIGDMDSIASPPSDASLDALKLLFPRSHIVPIKDQCTTDFEKALLFAKENRINSLLCVGILGKFADHSVYNLSLLARFGDSLSLLALSVHNEQCEWIFPLRAHTVIRTAPNLTISFLAFPEATLTTKGLTWELTDMPLSQIKQHSVRNKTQQDIIYVQSTGHCLAFLNSSAPPGIEYR